MEDFNSLADWTAAFKAWLVYRREKIEPFLPSEDE
jgi:hypothetical protein